LKTDKAGNNAPALQIDSSNVVPGILVVNNEVQQLVTLRFRLDSTGPQRLQKFFEFFAYHQFACSDYRAKRENTQEDCQLKRRERAPPT